VHELRSALSDGRLSDAAASQARSALAVAGLLGVPQSSATPVSMDWQGILMDAGRFAVPLAIVSLLTASLVFFRARNRGAVSAEDGLAEPPILSTPIPADEGKARSQSTEQAEPVTSHRSQREEPPQVLITPAPSRPAGPEVLVTPPPPKEAEEPLVLITPAPPPASNTEPDAPESSVLTTLRHKEEAPRILITPAPPRDEVTPQPVVVDHAEPVTLAAAQDDPTIPLETAGATGSSEPETVIANPARSEIDAPKRQHRPIEAPRNGVDSFYNRVVTLGAAYRIDRDALSPVLSLAYQFPGLPSAEGVIIGIRIWSELSDLAAAQILADDGEPDNAHELWDAVAEEMSGLAVWVGASVTQPCKMLDGNAVARGTAISRTLAPGLVVSDARVPAIVVPA